MSEVILMGNGGSYGCLIEPQGISASLKEPAQTRVFLLSRSMNLNQANQALITHNAHRHCRPRFYTFVGQPLSK